ncbi:hypothetical protein MNBD_GAMMA05-1815 [hydrothermal vent metagenome]|uniref:Uncharacterized protein n=1 Tax=hydrothermal vent metagenome TaxID=652676 RepID=A0A3B0WG78_9ZZZZ
MQLWQKWILIRHIGMLVQIIPSFVEIIYTEQKR